MHGALRGQADPTNFASRGSRYFVTPLSMRRRPGSFATDLAVLLFGFSFPRLNVERHFHILSALNAIDVGPKYPF